MSLDQKLCIKKIKGYYPEIIDYFPEYQENHDFLPPKKFMWNIFSTKYFCIANKFISYSLKERNLKDFEGKRTVEVSEDVYIYCIQLTAS